MHTAGDLMANSAEAEEMGWRGPAKDPRRDEP